MSSRRTFGVLPVSLFYRAGRATALGRAFSRFWAAWAALGLPPHMQIGLEVRGRKTGQPRRLAVVIAKHHGREYLVSMMGEGEWVKNVRAAQGDAYLVDARRRHIRLEELPVEERPPIIREFLRVARGGRPHIQLGADATLADCERVAPHFPVFEIHHLDDV